MCVDAIKSRRIKDDDKLLHNILYICTYINVPSSIIVQYISEVFWNSDSENSGILAIPYRVPSSYHPN
jgi:hypothetical protein